MQIAILNFRNISSHSHGGAEVYLEKLAKEWLIMGHDVTFFSPVAKKAMKENKNLSVNYVEIGNSFTAYRKIPEAVLLEKWDLIIDCINVRGFHADSWISKFKKPPAHVALIFQTTEEVWNAMLPYPVSTLGRRFLEPYWLGKYKKSKVLTICESSAQSLIKFGIINASVLNPGFDLDRSITIPSTFNVRRTSEVIDIVFCARLVGMKRPFDAIQAVNLLSKLDLTRKYRLHIIGEGKLRRQMEKLSISLELDVTFHGRLTDRERNLIYANSDFLLATSVREGWGLTVSESAYFGCLPIVYNVPGLRDSAMLVGGIAVNENPESITDKILEVLSNDLEIENFSRRMSTWAETANKFLIKAF